MPILLITVSFVATVAAFWQMGRTTNDCFRSAFLKASILHGIIIAVLTEELSLSKSLTFEFIILGWSLFALLNCGILLIWVYQKQRRIRIDQITQEIWSNFSRQDVSSKMAMVGLSLGKDGLEYPLWVIMESQSSQPFKIKHINVKNQSQDLPPEFLDAELCATFKNR